MFNDPIAIKKFEEFEKKYKFNTIVETGTNTGYGAIWCSKFRDEVVTIENDLNKFNNLIPILEKEGFKLIFGAKMENFKFNFFQNGNRKIYSFNGDSAEVLNVILPANLFKRPFLFYLDAH